MLLYAKSISLALAYAFVALLPALGVALLGATSMALGLTIYCAILFAIHLGRLGLDAKLPRQILILALAAIAYFLVQLITGLSLLTAKAYASIALLAFVFLVAWLASGSVIRMGDRFIIPSIKILVGFIFVLFFLNQVFDLKFSGYTHVNAVVPFLEPSHFALFAGPVFLIYFALAESDKTRLYTLITIFIMSLLLPSTTMLAFSFLMMLIGFKSRGGSTILISAVLLVSSGVILSTQYFYDRILLSEESGNLSVLVYLQGIDDAVNSLINTNFMGLGFQMLGTQPPSPIALAIALQVDGGELNREDGSFLAAKLIAEFGIFGIGLVGLACYKSFISLRYLRNIVRDGCKKCDGLLVVAHGIGFSFLVELLVRGYGYFSPGVFTYILFSLYLVKCQRHSKLGMC